MKRKKVLLFGPELKSKNGAYGGGVGGYTRNMEVYLEHFTSDEYQLVPCFHTIREKKRRSFVLRFFIDAYRIISGLRKEKPIVMHILSIHVLAIPREFAAVILSRLFGVKVLFEIKAGLFEDWYKKTNFFFRWLTRLSLKYSNLILSEGQVFIPFVKNEFGRESLFFPNIVPIQEVPKSHPPKLQSDTIKVLFVGYAYKGKGVFELVEGCHKAALEKGVKIELSIVGKESPEFTPWLDQFEVSTDNLKINRIGLLPHPEVINQFNQNDVYCYPTYHYGEGHNNSINEAMMMKMVIVSSKAGFLGDVLDDDCAYLMDKVTVESIAEKLSEVYQDYEGALKKAQLGYDKLMANYTSPVAKKKMVNHYRSLDK